MSTVTVYKPHPDPWHPFREDDPLGDAMAPPSAPYSVSKIAEEGVARYCARSFDLPVTIARMGAAYGDQSGLPVWHLDAIAAGEPVRTRWDPMPYSPIHDDDICAQLEPLLDAASVPATIVNWCGRRAGERAGVVGVLRRAARRRRRRCVVDGDPGRVGRIGGRPHQAHRDHRSVPGRLARRLPPRGRALLSRPRAAGQLMAASSMSRRRAYPSAEALLADATETTGLADFGPGDFREGLDVLLESLGARRRSEPGDRRRRRRTISAGAW